MNPCRQIVIRCAECGVEKKETNHWFVLLSSSGDGVRRTLLTLFHFSEELLKTFDDAQALCGESCVVKVVAKVITGVTDGNCCRSEAGTTWQRPS